MQEKNQKKEYKVFTNYEIFKGKVRLIIDGEQPKIVDRDEAISIAKSQGKDLVQIAYNKNDFPHSVCKLIDYGKYLYDMKKKEKLARKQARANEQDIKEVDFSIRIDQNDLDTKVRMIRKFISENNKVKICIKLLRRELRLTDYAKNTMKTILAKVEDCAEFDVLPTASENILSCILKKKS